MSTAIKRYEKETKDITYYQKSQYEKEYKSPNSKWRNKTS